jgi:hypothetical protein
MGKSVAHLEVIEQAPIKESRDAFIDLGSKSFRAKPTVAEAFSMFREQNNYSKVTDALNQCLEDALRIRGYLPKSTSEDVGIRGEKLGAMSLAFAHLIVRHADAIAECMRANNCNHARAVEILFGLGIERGRINGFTLAQSETETERLRA